jgi:hypothetical protein
MVDPQIMDGRTLPDGYSEKGAPGGPHRFGVEGMGRLFQQKHARNAESGGGADHRTHIGRILKRKAKRTSRGPRTAIPTRKRGHFDEQDGGSGIKPIDLLKQLGSERKHGHILRRNTGGGMMTFFEYHTRALFSELDHDLPHLLGPPKEGHRVLPDPLGPAQLQECLEGGVLGTGNRFDGHGFAPQLK